MNVDGSIERHTVSSILGKFERSLQAIVFLTVHRIGIPPIRLSISSKLFPVAPSE